MAQERKDVEKFLKHLGTRFYQVIVQSRSGKKQLTRSVPPSKSKTANSPWYWLDIPNNPQVGDGCADIPPPSLGRPLCVEVAVETPEGDMVLETWVLSLEKPFDDSERMFVVYRSLSNLLRSVIVVSRTMTGYHLARQYRGDVTLKHRFYNGKPKLEGLGKCSNDYNVQKLGSVPTMLGRVSFATAWRKDDNIKLEAASSSTLSMTSDYFNLSQVRQLPDQRDTVPATQRRNSSSDPVEIAQNITMPALPQPPLSIEKLSPQSSGEDQIDGGTREGFGFSLHSAFAGSPLQMAFANHVGVPLGEALPFEQYEGLFNRSLTPVIGRHESVGLTPVIGRRESVGSLTPSLDTTLLEESTELREEGGCPGQGLLQLDTSDFEHLEVKTAFDPSDDTEDVGLFYRRLRQLPRTLPVLDKWDNAPSDLSAALQQFEDKGKLFNTFTTSLVT